MIIIDDKNVNKTAMKLHRQFGHPTADKLVDLIEKSGCLDDNVRKAIEKVSSECETCLKFSKAAPRRLNGSHILSGLLRSGKVRISGS